MAIQKQTLADLDFAKKRVIIRVDFNVPIKNGQIKDDTRIIAALPTLKKLLDADCKIIALSHLSRIKTLEDKQSGKKSLAPVADRLRELLGSAAKRVVFANTTKQAEVKKLAEELAPREILVLENTRYYDVDDTGKVVKAESKNDPALGQFWASLGDVFVNDAFGTAHRAHASNVGIATVLQANSCVGLLIEDELEHLQKLLTPKHPFVVVLGGAKVSDKLKIIQQLLVQADQLLIGGGMAYTFFKAQGLDVASSLVEPEMLDAAREILNGPDARKLVLPVDQLGANEFADVPAVAADIGKNPSAAFMGLDIGPKTAALFEKAIAKAKTIFWNGPMGVYEFKHFIRGSEAIAKAIAKATQENGAYSVIGGGDCAAAINQVGLADQVSFVSTGGGASMTLVEGSPLPGIETIANVA